jgi:hypothetical protein
MKYLDWSDSYHKMNRWKEVLVEAVDEMEEWSVLPGCQGKRLQESVEGPEREKEKISHLSVFRSTSYISGNQYLPAGRANGREERED